MNITWDKTLETISRDGKSIMTLCWLNSSGAVVSLYGCVVSEEEVHAEICYAECLLERAILMFIQDENLISFIKGSLKVKECYSCYKLVFLLLTASEF